MKDRYMRLNRGKIYVCAFRVLEREIERPTSDQLKAEEWSRA